MSKQLDLKKLLPKYKLERVSFDDSAYEYRFETPAHKFRTLIAPFLHGDYFVALTTKDYFDPEVAKEVLKLLKTEEKKIDPKRVAQVLEGLGPGCQFDSVLLLGPEGHQKFDGEAHARAFEAIPIYRCEFPMKESGDLQDPDWIELVRRDFVDTLNWKREPAPLLKLRFQNTKTGGGSKGKKLGLEKLENLHIELDELTDKAGSFIEIKNFKDEQCRLVVSEKKFVINFSEPPLPPISVPKKEIHDWVDAFLIKGVEAKVK